MFFVEICAGFGNAAYVERVCVCGRERARAREGVCVLGGWMGEHPRHRIFCRTITFAPKCHYNSYLCITRRLRVSAQPGVSAWNLACLLNGGPFYVRESRSKLCSAMLFMFASHVAIHARGYACSLVTQHASIHALCMCVIARASVILWGCVLFCRPNAWGRGRSRGVGVFCARLNGPTAANMRWV